VCSWMSCGNSPGGMDLTFENVLEILFLLLLFLLLLLLPPPPPLQSSSRPPPLLQWLAPVAFWSSSATLMFFETTRIGASCLAYASNRAPMRWELSFENFICLLHNVHFVLRIDAH
jgi:hypothetical protein